MFDGFELDAKPVSFERFFKAITKLNRMMGQRNFFFDHK